MATFVHIFDARSAKKILREGLRAMPVSETEKAVFCVPVVQNFQTTFQWLRELKRAGYRTACAAQFKIPDSERVMVGRFAKPQREMTAARAVAFFRDMEHLLGFEVLVMRKIEPKEITRIRAIPQISGWRYYPEAKGRQPRWPSKGEVNASRLRRVMKYRNQEPFGY